MSPIFQVILAVQMSAPLASPPARTPPQHEARAVAVRSALRASAIRDAATSMPSVAIQSTGRPASPSFAQRAADHRALPTYQPSPEEWIAHFAAGADLSHARVTRAARWAAAFPLRVHVGSSSVSMGLTFRTP